MTLSIMANSERYTRWPPALLVCLMGLLALAACREDESPIENDGSLQVSRSVAGTVAVVAGGSQTISITFTAVDGSPLSALMINSGLIALPAGWSGPASFSCATVSNGSGCVLELTYAPTGAASGELMLDYSYLTSAGSSQAGALAIEYLATTANHVIGAASPSGQIGAIVGTGSQAVAVTFTTDDGYPATELAVTTDLTSLPVGWSSASNNFGCSEVSTGNGCQLSLSYAPASVGGGTLSLQYGYRDNSGAAKAGSINLGYAATSHNNLVGTVAPSGQINATVGAGSQAVAVTFTTDDGNPVSNVAVTTDLSMLPSGWASASPSFSCNAASSGSSCQLSLTYAPLTIGSGTLTLQYGYDDNSGTPRTGNVTIPYSATSNNNVVGTAAPSGQITATVGASQAVTVTFATDDGNPASALSVTTDLASLPTGWSSTSSSFSCGSVASGSGCQLALTYAPSAPGSGTLSLNYGYTNNSGTAKTGSVNIPYVSYGPHVYVAQLTGSIMYCAINSNGTLNACTATGDVGSGASGIVFKGNLAYVTDFYNKEMYVCHAGANGSLSNCVSTGSNFFYPFVTTISGNFLYAANLEAGHAITYCSIGSDGSLSGCAETSGLQGVEGITVTSNYAYASRPHSNAVYVCQRAVDGSLSACAVTGSGFSQPEEVTISGNYAFVANTANGTVTTCAVNSSNGTLSSCTNSAVGSGPMGIAFHDNRAYVSSRYGNVYVCDVSGTGTLSNCVTSNGGASFGLLVQIAVH